MDEQRQQSYLSLIDRLLTCENGQEPEILRVNQHLIDADLVQTMKRVVGVLIQREASQQAEWLRQLANQLAEALATSPLSETRDRVAYRQVRSFQERFGKAHLYLAYHAAFPLALNPDLLYKIWANFQRDLEDRLLNIPWEAVADVLLSGLCKEVGTELYEMDVAVRNLLLSELKDNPRLGEKRLDELSQFVLEYVKQQLDDEDPDIRDFAHVQKWTALAYTKPDEAARDLALALREKVQEQDKSELVRMASVVETLAEPLVGFQPLLVYSRGMGKLARGDSEGAGVEFRDLATTGDWIRVKGVSLPVPSKDSVDESKIRDLGERLQFKASSKESLKAYINLIHLLLTCPNGQEIELLRANDHLLNSCLVEVLDKLTISLANKTQNNIINLINFFKLLRNKIFAAIDISDKAQSKQLLIQKNKLVILKFSGELLQGLSVTLEIWLDGETPAIQIPGKLPAG